MRIYLGVLLLLAAFFGASAQNPMGSVADFSSKWQVYEGEEGIYVPYMPAYHGAIRRLHLVLPTKQFEPYYLLLEAKGASHLFLNNNLHEVFGADGRMLLNVRRVRELAGTDTVLVTVYAQTGRLEQPKAYIVKYTAKPSDWLQHSDTETLLALGNLYGRQTSLTLIGLGLLALLVASVRLSIPIFQWEYLRRYISLFTKVKNEGGRISAQGFLVFAIFYSLALAYAILLFVPDVQQSVFDLPPTLLGKFLNLGIWMAGFLGLRILMVAVAVSLYSFRRGLNIHMQEIVDVNQLYTLALFVAAVVLHLSNLLQYPAWQVLAQILFVLSLLGSSGFVAYRINKSFPFRKVYLFSYLCATEFFPVLILIKLLVGEWG